GTLEEAFEEPLEGGQGGHDRGRLYQRARVSPCWTVEVPGRVAPSGTIPATAQYGGPGGAFHRALYSRPWFGPCIRSARLSAPVGGPMPEILTESFCERCGTRYTFESSASRAKPLRGLKTLSKG